MLQNLIIRLLIIWVFYLVIIKFIRFAIRFEWIKREILHKYNYFKLRYYEELFVLKKISLNLVITIVFLILIIVFLISIEFIEIEKDCFNFNNIILNLYENKCIDYNYFTFDLEEYRYDFLWSQISSTLIISTVIGFLGIFSTSYVYGKKQINIIFSEKGFFSLTKMFVYLIILVFISFSCCICNKGYNLILLSFIISLVFIFLMLFKILLFYSFPQHYENKLKYEYLIREKKHIEKAMPLFPYKDVEIETFKIRTMELIQMNDNDYNKNISVLMNLLKISLLNNRKKIQEYYTELINRTDFLSSILEIIQHLIDFNKTNEAINIMEELFSNLKYYRLIPVEDFISFNIIHSLIIKGKEIDNELEAQKHFRTLWNIINIYKYLLYLYFCELDFSYCRLGKINKDGSNNIYFITHNNYLEDMYMAIRENNYLSKKEKEKIFDDLYHNIIMMEIEENIPMRDVRHIKEYKTINENKISIPIIIKGEPIVLMFLRMFEEEDIENIKMFSFINLSDNLRTYILTLTSLALAEFIKKECKRKYVNDLNITETKIINYYNKSNFGNHLDINENLYDILKDNYITDTNKKRNYYSLRPRLTLSIEIINNYFYYNYVIKLKSKDKFNKITKLKKFNPDQTLIEIFKKMGI